MPTPPFGAVLEAALKRDEQGGKLFTSGCEVVNPRYFCCISGNTVGVTKDPIAILHVTPLGGCSEPGDGSGTWFSADVTRSYSATSTIASYRINWGDGVDTGWLAWPQGAPDTHQYLIGGITAPIYYTITLTVRDMLTATGVDTVQVAVIDCSVLPDIEAFAACGASGLWYTISAGRLWIERGAPTFNGIPIRALGVNPHTITGIAGTDNLELWIATETTLYKSQDSGHTAIPIPLPYNAQPYAITFSPLPDSDGGVYILGVSADSNTGWLFRSTDGGITWASIQVFYYDIVGETAATVTVEHVFGADLTGGQWAHSARLMSTVGAPSFNSFCGEAGVGVLKRRDTAPYTWNDTQVEVAGTALNVNHSIDWKGASTNSTTVGDNGGLFRAPPWQAIPILAGSWRETSQSGWGAGAGLMFMSATQIIVTDGAPAWNITSCTAPGVPGPWALPTADARFLAIGIGFLLVADGGVIYRGDFDPVQMTISWAVEWSGPWTPSAPFDYWQTHGWISMPVGATRLLRRTNGIAAGPSTWEWDTVECPQDIDCIFSRDTGGAWGMYAGTDGKIYKRLSPAHPWIELFDLDRVERVTGDYAGVLQFYAATSGAGAGIVKFTVGGTKVTGAGAVIGSHYALSVSADGEYVYIALSYDNGNPLIRRVGYDLAGLATIYDPGDGLWGGVFASPGVTNRVYIFGDFGSGNKLRVSDDYGTTWTNITEGTWGVTEMVRPLFVDWWYGDRVVVCLNNALEVWQYDGADWAQIGSSLPFLTGSGEMDWVNPMNLFIGRLEAGPNPIQFSPDSGARWLVRSTGIIPVDAPITAIVITA